MKLLKQNSYEIVRLVINQVGITIFSLVLYTGLNFTDDPQTTRTLRIVLSVFATLFYLTLLYNAGWEYGSKDKIKLDSGRYTKVPAKGAIMSLAANSVNILLALIVIAFTAIYLASGSEALYSIAGVIIVIIRFTSAMYLGIIQAIFAALPEGAATTYLWETVGYAVLPVLAIGATQLGYALGLRDYRLVYLFKADKGSSEK